MASKQLETINGTVEQVNAKQTGIKVAGEWLNLSMYHPVSVMPPPGELVEVQVERSDRGAWINNLRIVGTTATVATSDRDREIRRMSALRSAATFCAGRSVSNDVSSADVLKVAAAFLRWLEGGEQSA